MIGFNQDDLSTTGFLPFLDILLSAIGIFLLIIALQKITDQMEASSAQADVIVIVQTDNRLTWINLEEQNWKNIQYAQLIENIKVFVERFKKPINLIIAFNANNLTKKRDIDNNLTNLARDTNANHINFRIVWWPLSSQSEAAESFLAHWGISLTNEGEVLQHAAGDSE